MLVGTPGSKWGAGQAASARFRRSAGHQWTLRCPSPGAGRRPMRAVRGCPRGGRLMAAQPLSGGLPSTKPAKDRERQTHQVRGELPRERVRTPARLRLQPRRGRRLLPPAMHAHAAVAPHGGSRRGPYRGFFRPVGSSVPRSPRRRAPQLRLALPGWRHGMGEHRPRRERSPSWMPRSASREVGMCMPMPPSAGGSPVDRYLREGFPAPLGSGGAS